jgi:hypothetical protein
MVVSAMFANQTRMRLEAARMLAEEIGRHLDIAATIRLWDGSQIPLGTGATDG